MNEREKQKVKQKIKQMAPAKELTMKDLENDLKLYTKAVGLLNQRVVKLEEQFLLAKQSVWQEGLRFQRKKEKLEKFYSKVESLEERHLDYGAVAKKQKTLSAENVVQNKAIKRLKEEVANLRKLVKRKRTE